MAPKANRNIDTTVKKYIAELEQHIRVERVILFGSCSRGEQGEYSDIDLAVVSPDFHGGTEEDYLLLGRVARKIDPLLEALPYGPEDFPNRESGDFLDEIVRTGRVVYKKAA